MAIISLISIIVFGVLLISPIVRWLASGNEQQQPKRRSEMGDFFRIDINDMFRYSPTLTERDERIARYHLRLPDYELGTFYDAEVIAFGDGTYNLSLVGRDRRLTKELAEFIGFCADRFGIDDNGNRELTHEDYQRADLGTFARWWGLQLRIDNMANGRMEMTIYGLRPRSVQQPEN